MYFNSSLDFYALSNKYNTQNSRSLLPSNVFSRYFLSSFADINDLDIPKTCKTEFPDANDLLNFRLVIEPDEGFYRGGRFTFSFKIGPNYPHEPPKVKCTNKVYHPNIDLEGNVCLNILREDWKPVLTVNAIVYGLQYLFLEPNPEDPLNKEAARELQDNKRAFEQNVHRTMRGGSINGVVFEKCLKN